jgi:hypothetical protein
MDICASSGARSGARRGAARRGTGRELPHHSERRRIDDQVRALEHEPHELALRRGLPAAGAGADGDVDGQDDTSDNQLIAR